MVHSRPPRLVAQLTARLRTLRPDGVIVHHIGPMIYGGTAARLARVPRILHVEHDAWHYESSRRRALSGLFFKLVRPSRVAVSQEIATKVASYFPGRAVNVIAPGVDMDLFRPRDRAAARVRLGMATDVPLIGTSGRLVPVKSQATLIEALALLRREPNLKLSPLPQLVIVGEGPERGALHALAVERGVAGAVHLLGHRDDLAEVLPSFDIYSLPSLNEGLPRGVLEAQAVGLPVVASNVGALADAVCPETGRLVPAGDAPALAAALADLITHPPDVRISRRFVETRFALATTLSAFNSLLQR